MSYDPNLPQNGQPLDADVLRAQLQAIVQLMSSIPKGDPGDPGPTGPQGPPFAQAVVDAVTTRNSWESAGVSVSYDGNAVHFSFDIPRGQDGAAGLIGPPGEVTLQQMKSTTSANTNAVSTLDTAFTNDPPTLADFETLRSKLNELIQALRQN